MADRHGWNSWEEYQTAHDGFMRHFDFFIQNSTLNFVETEGTIVLKGELYCDHGIEIHVNKVIEVEKPSGRPFVRTTEYTYHVLRRMGDVTTNLFRYDNVHQHQGHEDRHHRHEYDADGIDFVTYVGYAGWPTLGDVLEETRQWCLTHISEQH